MSEWPIILCVDFTVILPNVGWVLDKREEDNDKAEREWVGVCCFPVIMSSSMKRCKRRGKSGKENHDGVD